MARLVNCYAFDGGARANVDAVKGAIENLTAVEYTELQHWLKEKDSSEQPIDYQLKADLDSGKLDDFLNQAIADHKAGKTEPLCDSPN